MKREENWNRRLLYPLLSCSRMIIDIAIWGARHRRNIGTGTPVDLQNTIFSSIPAWQRCSALWRAYGKTWVSKYYTVLYPWVLQCNSWENEHVERLFQGLSKLLWRLRRLACNWQQGLSLWNLCHFPSRQKRDFNCHIAALLGTVCEGNRTHPCLKQYLTAHWKTFPARWMRFNFYWRLRKIWYHHCITRLDLFPVLLRTFLSRCDFFSSSNSILKSVGRSKEASCGSFVRYTLEWKADANKLRCNLQRYMSQEIFQIQKNKTYILKYSISTIFKYSTRIPPWRYFPDKSSQTECQPV